MGPSKVKALEEARKVEAMGYAKMEQARGFVDSHIARAQVEAHEQARKVKAMGHAKMEQARGFVDSQIAQWQVKAEEAAERKFNIPIGTAAHLRKGVKLALKTKKSMAAKKKGGRVKAMRGRLQAMGGGPSPMGGGIFDRFRGKKIGSDTSKALESISTAPAPVGVIPPHAKIYAAAARGAYTVPSPARIRDPVTGNIWTRLEGNRDRQVYTLGDKAIIAYKGTNNIDDLALDTTIFTGFQGYTHRFREALRLARRINETYDTTVTGHSLGGSLAQHVSQHVPNIKAYVFNGAASLNMAGCLNNRCKNVEAYTTGRDILSLGTKVLGNTTSIGVHNTPVQMLKGAAKAAAMLTHPLALHAVNKIATNHSLDNFITAKDQQAQEGI